MSINLEQEVEVRMWTTTKKHFNDLGYNFPINTIFKVKIKDLPTKSNIGIIYSCDKCGREVHTTYNAYNKNKRLGKVDICIKCKTPTKTTYKSVFNYFNKNNCELITKEIKSQKTKVLYIAQCGHENTIKISDFYNENGRLCTECANKNKGKTFGDIDTVKEIFKDGGCELLENEYVNNQTPMKFRCGCGNISKIALNHFKNGGRCIKCAYVRAAEKTRLSQEEVEKIFLDGGGKLLSEYKNTYTPVKFKCNCGNTSFILVGSFAAGGKCGCRRHLKGKDNPNYDHSLTEEDRLATRKFPEYHQWRTDIFTKDNYTCQCCGKHGTTLNAHHFLNYSSNPDLRLNISNGITLCKKCHKLFHHIFGIKNNTKEQVNEFIKLNNSHQEDAM